MSEGEEARLRLGEEDVFWTSPTEEVEGMGEDERAKMMTEQVKSCGPCC